MNGGAWRRRSFDTKPVPQQPFQRVPAQGSNRPGARRTAARPRPAGSTAGKQAVAGGAKRRRPLPAIRPGCTRAPGARVLRVPPFRMRGPDWTPRLPFSPAGSRRGRMAPFFFSAAAGVRVQRAMPLARDSWVPQSRRAPAARIWERKPARAPNKAALCGAATAPIPRFS